MTRSKSVTNIIATILAVAPLTTFAAITHSTQVIVNTNGAFGLGANVGGAASPGAAFARFTNYASNSDAALTGADLVSSGINITCATFTATCQAPNGIATISDLSPHPGISSSVLVRGGNDLATLEFNANSSGGAGIHTRTDARAGEVQLLQFNIDGIEPGQTIEVDISYSLSNILTDNSTFTEGVAGGYNLLSSASIFVADSTTYDVPNGTDSDVAIAFVAVSRMDLLGVTSANDGFGTLQESAAGVETISIVPGRKYFVALQSDLIFETLYDVAGLSVTNTLFADPVFSLNPLFAQSLSEQSVASFTVEQIAVSAVPLPGAFWLLGAPLCWLLRRKFA